MSVDLGIVKPGTHVRIPFNTFSSDDPAASVTVTNLAAGDVEVHKDGSATQRASDSGVTVSIDFDTVTGQHYVLCDTADNTADGFWSAGSVYDVRVEGITVDAATLNVWVGRFTLGYHGSVLDTNIATYASQTSFTLTAGSADNDAYNGMWCVIHDKASAVQTQIGYISDYVGSTKTVTLVADPAIFTMTQYDNISIMGPAPLQATTVGNKLDVTSTGAAGVDWGNVENAGTTVDLSATSINLVDTATDVTNQVTADVTSISGDTPAADNLEAMFDNTGYNASNSTVGTVTTNSDMRGTDNAALASVVGALADAAAAGDPTASDTLMQYMKQLINILVGTTGVTTFPAEAAPANNVSLAEVIRAIHADVTGLNGDAMRGTDSAYTGTPPTVAQIADGVWDEAQADHTTTTTFGYIATEIGDILADTNELQGDWTNAGRLDAILDELTANVDAIETDTQDIQTTLAAGVDVASISTSTEAADNLEASAETIVVGAAQTGTLSTTQMTTNLTEATDDHYNGRTIIWTSGVLQDQATDITDYNGTTKMLTFTAVTEAPSNSDTFIIV